MKLLKEYKAAEFSGAALMWGNSSGFIVHSPDRTEVRKQRLEAERLYKELCAALRKERDEVVLAFYATYLGRTDCYEALFQCPELVEEMNRDNLTAAEMIERLEARQVK